VGLHILPRERSTHARTERAAADGERLARGRVCGHPRRVAESPPPFLPSVRASFLLPACRDGRLHRTCPQPPADCPTRGGSSPRMPPPDTVRSSVLFVLVLPSPSACGPAPRNMPAFIFECPPLYSAATFDCPLLYSPCSTCSVLGRYHPCEHALSLAAAQRCWRC